MAGADFHSICRVEIAKRRQYIVIVEERLSLAHSHCVAHALLKIFAHKTNLIVDFSHGKVSRETTLARRAERAVHGAPRLS